MIAVLVLLAQFMFGAHSFVQGSSGPPSWAVVNQSYATSGSGAAVSLGAFSNPLTPGSTIVVFCNAGGAGGSFYATDSAGNTYSDVGVGVVSTGPTSFAGLYTVNSFSTSSNVITCHQGAGASFVYGNAQEITGGGASPIDVASSLAAATGGAAGSNNLSSTALTPTLDGDFILSYYSTNLAFATVGTSPNLFTLINGGPNTLLSEYFVQSTAALIQPTASDSSSSEQYGNITVALK